MIRLAHLSDSHVSLFGDSFHFRRHRVVRSKARFVSEGHTELWQERGWRVLTDAKKKKLVVVDPDGFVHKLPAAKGQTELQAAEDYARRVDARRSTVLAADPPDAEALRRLYEATPENTNLRLLNAARSLSADTDIVFLTGDLTDDGDGYEAIESAFLPWIRRGRFFAVPGNHDLYTVLLPSSARPKPTRLTKRAAWESFAERVGLNLHESGAWSHYLQDEGIYLVGLDSCAKSQQRFFLHNGAIGAEQIAYLRKLAQEPAWQKAKARLVGLHHHVVPLPHGIGRRAPPEIGMRLDDAKEVAQVLNELRVDLVMHGHRHVSEERRPAGCNFRILAAPSATLGCRSGDGPSYWQIDCDERLHTERIMLPWPSLEHASVTALPTALDS